MVRKIRKMEEAIQFSIKIIIIMLFTTKMDICCRSQPHHFQTIRSTSLTELIANIMIVYLIFYTYFSYFKISIN